MSESYEWDPKKNKKNQEKHVIDFVRAREAFSDERGFTYASPIETGERRFVRVGLVEGRLVAVVHVRRNDSIRIISARRARKEERAWYG